MKYIFLILIIVWSCKDEKVNNQELKLSEELEVLKSNYQLQSDSLIQLEKELKSLKSRAKIGDEELIRLLGRQFYVFLIEVNLRPKIKQNADNIFMLDLDEWEKELLDLNFLTESFIKTASKKCESCVQVLKRDQLTEMELYEEPRECSFIEHANFWTKLQESYDALVVDQVEIMQNQGTAKLRLFVDNKKSLEHLLTFKLSFQKSGEAWKIRHYEIE